MVKIKFEDLRLNGLANNDGRLAKKMFVDAVPDALSKTEESKWLNAIDKEQAVNGIGRNKLKTYRLIKRTCKTNFVKAVWSSRNLADGVSWLFYRIP